jgi:hypothetical protein
MKLTQMNRTYLWMWQTFKFSRHWVELTYSDLEAFPASVWMVSFRAFPEKGKTWMVSQVRTTTPLLIRKMRIR